MDRPGPRDEELVERMRSGDADAGQTLFERHSETLRARVQHRLPKVIRGKLGASDVIQDTWLAVCVRLPEFQDRGEGSFARWLNGIAAHKLVDGTRRYVGAGKRDARREVAHGSPSTARGTAARVRTPSELTMAAERAQRVRTEIERLPPAHREVLRLVHDEGLTLVAAGARMGRTADAARKLYGRALAGLTERLSGNGKAAL